MRISSDGRRFRFAVIAVVLIAVLTVLLAPSIDMPETVLREHHVAAHSVVNNNAGTLTVVGMISGTEAFQNGSVDLAENSRTREHEHSQASLVLRCQIKVFILSDNSTSL